MASFSMQGGPCPPYWGAVRTLIWLVVFLADGGFSVFGVLHGSSPQAAADLRVIISGLFVLFQVKRYKKSVKNFELIAIYLILLQFYPQGTGVVTGAIAV